MERVFGDEHWSIPVPVPWGLPPRRTAMGAEMDNRSCLPL